MSIHDVDNYMPSLLSVVLEYSGTCHIIMPILMPGIMVGSCDPDVPLDFLYISQFGAHCAQALYAYLD